MKIAFVTTGRFHVLDLARELHRAGHDIRFHSCLPARRLTRFGLPASCGRSLLRSVWPYLVLRRLNPGAAIHRWATRRLLEGVDRVAAERLAPCDVLIGMSGIALEAGLAARRRYGARFWLERGSRHILSQKAILEGLPGQDSASPGVLDFQVERELAGYEAADRVIVPSRHVEDSFLERGFPAQKLIRMSYGVDIEVFRPTPPPAPPQTVLFVGEWSRRKGADVLTEAMRSLKDVRLLHVGLVGDVPFPGDKAFVHVPPVAQERLPDYYRKAHAFALASREDGFGMVLIQALACGVPVVCTDRTGGPDLRERVADPAQVTVVRAGDVRSLAEGLRQTLSRQPAGPLRDGLGASRSAMTWEAYGKRYEKELLK